MEPANGFYWSDFGHAGDVKRIHHGGEANVIVYDLPKTEKGCFWAKITDMITDFLLLLAPNNQITRFPTYIVAFIKSLDFPLFL